MHQLAKMMPDPPFFQLHSEIHQSSYVIVPTHLLHRVRQETSRMPKALLRCVVIDLQGVREVCSEAASSAGDIVGRGQLPSHQTTKTVEIQTIAMTCCGTRLKASM